MNISLNRSPLIPRLRHSRSDECCERSGYSNLCRSRTTIISETSADALDETISVLFHAVVLGIKHAARIMQEQKSGVIISTASVAGFFTGFAPHVYSACKAAVIQLTRSGAIELGEHEVRVNCICPGPIATPILGNALGFPADSAETLAQHLTAFFSNTQPIKRAGLPLDLAELHSGSQATMLLLSMDTPW